MKKLVPAAILLLLAAMLSACSTIEAVREGSYVELASKPVVYRDEWARRSPPLVHVRPKGSDAAGVSALFIPFRVTQPISDPDIVGYSVARTIWQSWLAMELFPTLEFSSNHGPFRRDTALALARAKGADLMIGGFVTYYYAGGSASDSQVAIQLEIYDSGSGQMIWSMGQSALMPASSTNDFLLFSTKSRLPSDPMYALTKTMAEDMGLIIRNWATPKQSPESRLRRMDESIRDSLRREERSSPPPGTPGETQERPAL